MVQHYKSEFQLRCSLRLWREPARDRWRAAVSYQLVIIITKTPSGPTPTPKTALKFHLMVGCTHAYTYPHLHNLINRRANKCTRSTEVGK